MNCPATRQTGIKLAIMQPYFLPYIGYFQLIASVDHFILYDNIKYTKKGWINRNYMLQDCNRLLFSLPLRKASDSLDIVERELSPEFNRKKLLNQFRNVYSRAPQFDTVYPVLEQIVLFEDGNLFRYVQHSVIQICHYLGIKTEIKISSDIGIDHKLKGVYRVLALCKALDARVYVNPIGGIRMYAKKEFHSHGIDLRFINPGMVRYEQFSEPFVPWLTIVDVMMFNPVPLIHEHLYSYNLL